MIDPFNITNFNRTDSELEEFLLFCIFVANKSAERTSQVLEKFLNGAKNPMQRVKDYAFHGNLLTMLRSVKTGQYTRIERCLIELIMQNLNLRKCSVEDLERIYGIGPKTARYFILHSRKNADVACLDTHALKYLKEQGIENVPKSTPIGKEYKKLEKIFIEEAKKNNMNVANFDLTIWTKYAKKKGLKK